MVHAIEEMLRKYNCQTLDSYRFALKEIIQEIALLGLDRANFFDKAAFYGGTAIRILYGLDRFSEDIDFSLLEVNPHFDLQPYCQFVQQELQSFGFHVDVQYKEKKFDSNIESAFIKSNTSILLLNIGLDKRIIKQVHANEILKIKMEIDTTPPGSAETEIKYLLNPIPFHVRIYKQSYLFAGKVHALLCRQWSGCRIKGRDLYDYVWYLSNNIPLNASHLQARMMQTGHLSKTDYLDSNRIKTYLLEKFGMIDYKQATEDVLPFIRQPEKLHLWSEDFFRSITSDRLIIE